MNKKPTVLIVHGIGGCAGKHWQQWLHDELERQGCKVIMPSLPDADRPDRNVWMGKIRKLLENEKEVVLVGHSLGVVSLLDALEELPVTVAGFYSVSGFASDYGAPLNSYFLKEKTVRFDCVLPKIRRSFVFYGDNDPYVPQDKLSELANILNAQKTVLANGGHLNTDAGFTKFHLLLSKIQEAL